MPSLRAQLTVRLDASSLVQAFLTNVQGSAAALQGITDPTPASPLATVNTDLAGIDLGSLDGAVTLLKERALALAGSLPLVSDVVKPVTAALAVVESLVANPQVGDLEARLKALTADLAGILEGPREHGVLGALHAISLALGEAPEAALLKGFLEQLTAEGGIAIPSVPIADAIGALDGAVRVIGGLMVLDSVTSDIERLTRLMSARLDPRVLDRELATLEAALSLDGGELSDAMAAVSAGDLPRVQRIVTQVVGVAAALDRLRDEYAAAMGLGEATLVYLDVPAFARELDGARTLIRTGDLAPLKRLCTQLAGGLQPFLRTELLEGPTHELDALLADVEGRLADIAGRITALDVTQLVQPLDEGLQVLTAPIDRLRGLLDEVRVAYQGALGTVRDGVAALPVRAIADAIRGLLEPIGRVLQTIQQLVADVLAALQAAADVTTGALHDVEGHVDALTQAVDGLFGEVRTFLASLNLDGALGAVEENLRKAATALEQARMEPYFTTAARAIDTAAGVIGAVPFALLPESMKADVDAAVAPIKNADAGVLEAEIESLLQISPDGHFKILVDLDAAVTALAASYNALIDEVKKHEPRQALAPVDARLKELADRIKQLSPALTLQPVQDAIDRVKAALASLDVDKPIEPVRTAFNGVVARVQEFKPSTLIGDVEQRITAVRTQVTTLLRLPDIEQALDDVHARAVDLLDRYDPEVLQRRLELAMAEFIDLADQGPGLQLMSGVGAIVAGLLNGMGLRTYPHAFESVLRWLGGASAAADLNARVVNAGAATAAARATVDALDFQARAASVAARAARVRAAIGPLTVTLGGDAPAAAVLAGAEERLDAAAVFGFLETNRARFAAALAAATQRIQTITQAGFSDADVRVADLKTSIVPLDPAGRYVRRLLERLGLSGFDLGLAGVLRALLAAVPPVRLVGLARPIFDALRGRVQALVDAALAPLKGGVTRAKAALDAIDLAPLLQALDVIHGEVVAQIQQLSPDALLKPALDAVKALKQTLESADPLAPVLQILASVRDAVARVLAKLSLERLLAIPLAVYDELLAALSKLDAGRLIAPLRAQLDDIARQVDEGLDRTVEAFERLQAALPGGGGSSVSVGVSVG
jgi:hypothetical protein